MRKKKLSAAVAFALAAFAAAPHARADSLAAHWRDARVKWNAVGDKAAAGDLNAQQQLMDAVAACAPETDCFKTRHDVSETDLARLRAAWNACAEPAERAAVVCRRDLTNLTQTRIDAAAAAVNIAWVFKSGKLGEPDDQAAFDNYAFAAAFDHPVGQYNAGVYIMSGKFGEPNIEQAARYYLYAGQNGLPDGWIELGKLRQKHGDQKPFMSDLFAIEAMETHAGFARRLAGAPTFRNGASRMAPYANRDYFYQRALQENPSESQFKTIHKKIVSLTEFSPPPAAQAASPAPAAPTAPPKPQLNQATMSAARNCIARAEDMDAAKRERSAMDRELRNMREEIEENDRILSTAYTGYEDGPAASAADWNYRDHNANVAEYDAMVSDRSAFNREVNAIIDDYNAACAREWTLTKAEHEAVCAGKSSNSFCKGFNFQ